MNITEELRTIQDTIAQAESTVQRMEGKLDSIKETLQKNFGITDIDSANKHFDDLKQRKAELEKSIENRINRLQKAMKEYTDATAC